MSAAWLPAFPYLYRHPELISRTCRGTSFATQVLRPVVGIGLYAMAAALGWFVHPALAVAVFILVVAYYAWTSQGLRLAGQTDPAAGENRVAGGGI
jgi:hypothetical protein